MEFNSAQYGRDEPNLAVSTPRLLPHLACMQQKMRYFIFLRFFLAQIKTLQWLPKEQTEYKNEEICQPQADVLYVFN